MLFLWGSIYRFGAISIFSINVWAILGILLSTPLNISGVFYSYLTVHQGQLTINLTKSWSQTKPWYFSSKQRKKGKNVFLVMQLLYIMRHKETNATFSPYDYSYWLQCGCLVIRLFVYRFFPFTCITLETILVFWYDITSWVFRLSFSYQKLKNLNTWNTHLFLLRVKHRRLLFSCF